MMTIDKINNIYKGEVNTLNNSDNINRISIPKGEDSLLKKEEVGDSIDISNKGKKILNISGKLNQHVPINSTVYVDTGTILKIMDFSTNNKEYQWSEMGKDTEKRWVVINGQRFESPLSEEEKRLMRNASKTMLDYIKEAEDERLERDRKRGIKTNLSLGEDGKLNTSDNIDDPNIKNLMNNEVVCNMLSEMMSKGILNNISISV
ncbi:MAG: hypothetical protein ACRC1T_16705 [Clostridium chrysemydis]|uniref:hypothetical protein n=1 Tax=Clostridium chrysemydis TaxID=2665504 RepID=UPI003F36CBCD